MKKVLAVLVAMMMVMMLGACGNSRSLEPTNAVSADSIDTIFVDSLDGINSDAEEIMKSIGDTYETYTSNKEALEAWYEDSREKAEATYEEVNAQAIEYYKSLVADKDSIDAAELETAMNEFSESINNSYTDFETGISDIYTKINENVTTAMANADASLDYQQTVDASTEFNSTWINASQNYYQDWLDANTEFTETWITVYSGFIVGEYDVDKLLDEAQETIETEEISDDETGDSDGTASDSDFRKFMDDYEAFVDEYVAFMEKFNSSDDAAGMTAQYLKMLEKEAEMDAELDNINEDELSDEDYNYYVEVTTRCNEKLAKVAV